MSFNKNQKIIALIALLTLTVSCQAPSTNTPSTSDSSINPVSSSTISDSSDITSSVKPSVKSSSYAVIITDSPKPSTKSSTSANIQPSISPADATRDINNPLYLAYNDSKQYSGATPEKRYISVMNIDGSGKKVLRRFDGIQYFSWSPDSQKIVFISPEDNLNYVYVMDLEGKLTKLFQADSIYAIPAWFPDSQRIAYTSKSTIYSMNIDGTDQKKIIDYKAEYKTNGLSSVSPDGKTISYIDWEDGKKFYGSNLHLINIDGTNKKAILGSGGIWSKDSKTMLASNRYVLNLIDLATGQTTPITKEDMKENIYTYSWLSTDKIRYITTTVEGSNTTYHIKDINIDGSNKVELGSMTYTKDPTFKREELLPGRPYRGEALTPSAIMLLPEINKIMTLEAQCWIGIKDKKEVTFCADANEVAGTIFYDPEVAIINSDGSNKKFISFKKAYGHREAIASPDNQKIMYTESYVRRETYEGLGKEFISDIEGYPANYFTP